MSNDNKAKCIPQATDVLPNEIWRPRPSDNHGHGVNVTVRVPPDIARMLNQLTIDPRFPYGDRTDLVRHAIHRHIAFLSSFPGKVNLPIGQIMSAEQICEVEEAHQRFDKMLDRLHTIVQSLINKGTESAKQKAIHMIMQQLRYMKETGDEYYNELFTEKIESQHKDLIDQIPMVSPMDMSDEPLDEEDINIMMAETEEELDGEE